MINWLLGVHKPCTVYLAVPMTGYEKTERVAISRHADSVMRDLGLEPWSPVLEEHVKPGRGVIKADKKGLDHIWKELDKPVIRDKMAVMCLIDADGKSFGVEREYMLMRGVYWRPVVLVSPKHARGYFSIANYEDDCIVGTVEQAAAYIALNWGTLDKRIKWRLRMYARSLGRWILIHVRGFWL